MRLTTRVAKLEESTGKAELSAGAWKMLVQLLARRDAIFWPWRTWGEFRWPIVELQRAILSGNAGLPARASGESNWKAAHNERNELVSAGLVKAFTSGGQVTSLMMTAKGEADARAISAGQSSAMVRPFLDLFNSREPDRPDGWMSESVLFGGNLVGDPNEWTDLTELTLTSLTCGCLLASSDVPGRVYYKRTDAKLPEIVTSNVVAEEWAVKLYAKEWQTERKALERLESHDGGIVLPIPASR